MKWFWQYSSWQEEWSLSIIAGSRQNDHFMNISFFVHHLLFKKNDKIWFFVQSITFLERRRANASVFFIFDVITGRVRSENLFSLVHFRVPHSRRMLALLHCRMSGCFDFNVSRDVFRNRTRVDLNLVGTNKVADPVIFVILTYLIFVILLFYFLFYFISFFRSSFWQILIRLKYSFTKPSIYLNT
jgi:hypothetical protein